MRILYSTPFGSRLYGTATAISDTDVREVGLPKLDDLLLGVSTLKNISVATNKSGPGVKNTANDVDKTIVPLQILARDFIKGQTAAHEVVFSKLSRLSPLPPEAITFHNFCKELAATFLTRESAAIVGHAMSHNAMLEKLSLNQVDSAALEPSDWKGVMHCVRILKQSTTLMRERKITLPYDEATVNTLLQIRRGELSVKLACELVQAELAQFKAAAATSRLPDLTPELQEQFNAWLVVWLQRFYDIT